MFYRRTISANPIKAAACTCITSCNYSTQTTVNVLPYATHFGKLSTRIFYIEVSSKRRRYDVYKTVLTNLYIQALAKLERPAFLKTEIKSNV